MKQGIVAPGTVDGLFCLSAFLDRRSSHGMHVVPTTAATLCDAPACATSKGMHIVGLAENFSLAADGVSVLMPAQFLEACRRAHVAGEPISALVFTDQFVSAEFAPILVRRSDAMEFFPSLETIAAAKYGLPVHCWGSENEQPSLTGGSEGPAAVIRALSRYYSACNELGSEWLMRDRQLQRLPADRIDNAKRRLRLYQSILMLSSGEEQLSETHLATLKQLGAMRSALPELQRGMT